MDQNFDHNPEQNRNDAGDTSGQEAKQPYTDPNAGYQYEQTSQNGYYYQDASQQNQNQYQGYNNYQYSSNYGPNGNNGYQQPPYGGMDTSPMSMGDWILTILALMIPCAGIILYFVWAFSRNGNINRRNYCRAALIIEAVVIVLMILMMVVFGVSVYSTYPY